MDKDYIPKNLEEAFEYFKEHSDENEMKKWAELSERESMFQVHHGPGTALRNSWGLWGVGDDKTDIFKWFNTIGISMGDDLSGILYTSLHRHLNDKPVDLEEQVKVYWKHWRNYNAEQYLPPNIEGCSEKYLELYNEAVEAGEI